MYVRGWGSEPSASIMLVVSVPLESKSRFSNLSISFEETGVVRSFRRFCAASNNGRSITAAKAPSFLTHSDGGLHLGLLPSFLGRRFQTLFPMYFSFLRTWRTACLVQGRSRSDLMPFAFRASAIAGSVFPSHAI